MADIKPLISSLIQDAGTYLDNPGREAATKGWQLWIKSATGQEATLVRTTSENKLIWKPGQAEKFSQYFSDLLNPLKKDEPQQRGMGFGEVSIDWKPVYMPIVIKKVLPVILLFAGMSFAAGWYTNKITRRRR